jgi:hypothetical protein
LRAPPICTNFRRFNVKNLKNLRGKELNGNTLRRLEYRGSHFHYFETPGPSSDAPERLKCCSSAKEYVIRIIAVGVSTGERGQRASYTAKIWPSIYSRSI